MLVFILLIFGLLNAETPIFESIPIYDHFDLNSYWIISSALSPNALPAIVFGSMNGDVHLYLNGTVSLIAHLTGAVHGAFYDISQDGHQDLIVAHKFGEGCPKNCQPEDGFLSWLENPKIIGIPWKIHHIGKPADPGHRIIIANTALDRDFHRLISFPVAGANVDGLEEFTPFQISSYKIPHGAYSNWTEDCLTKAFTVCHEGKSLPSNDGFSITGSHGLAIYKQTEIPDQYDITYPIDDLSFEGEEHTGTCSSTFLSKDVIAFIAPLHGGHIGVSKGNQTVYLDEFELGGHDIQSGNFLPNTFTNQFIVAIKETLRSGAYFYSIDDDLKVTTMVYFNMTPSMLTVNDFDGDGKLDFASINWGRTNSSTVIIHYNRT
jgi:hypothetical protein